MVKQLNILGDGKYQIIKTNLPHYIFASFGKQDITFFHGAGVIEEKLSNQL